MPTRPIPRRPAGNTSLTLIGGLKIAEIGGPLTNLAYGFAHPELQGTNARQVALSLSRNSRHDLDIVAAEVEAVA